MRDLGVGPRINIYTCDTCGGKTVTVDIDDGVTPMMIDCRASGNEGDCLGTAMSAMYRVRPGEAGEPQWEWYKPKELAMRALSPGMLEHVKMGGLLLRRRLAVQGLPS